MQYITINKVFNLQRITQLTAALGAAELDAEQVHRAMQDRIHQPYRKSLVNMQSLIINNFYSILISHVYLIDSWHGCFV
jgi:homoserine kinase